MLFFDNINFDIKGNINTHLTENINIREAFDLGPIVAEEKISKTDKLEKVSFYIHTLVGIKVNLGLCPKLYG